MASEREESIIPGLSGDLVTFGQILRHPLGAVRARAAKMGSISCWMASLCEVASSDRFHISDCG